MPSITSPFKDAEKARENHAQTILHEAKSEAVELSKAKESPFQAKKFGGGRIMAGMESVQ